MERLNFDDLHLFVTVVESKSFSAAARKLGCAKSKVSRTISNIETSYGGQVFYRTTREINLTDMGQKLYAMAQPGIQSIREGLASISQDSVSLRGTIKITAVEDIGIKILTPIIAKFSGIYPLVHFEMLFTQETLDLVKHSIDVALRVGPTSQQTYKTRSIGNIEFIFVASPRYLARFSDTTNPRILPDADLITFHGPTGRRKINLNSGKDSVSLEIKPKFAGTNSDSLLYLARQGIGVAYIPRFVCLDDLKSGQLREIFHGWTGPSRKLNLVTPGTKKPTPLVEAFLKFAATELRITFSAA